MAVEGINYNKYLYNNVSSNNKNNKQYNTIPQYNNYETEEDNVQISENVQKPHKNYEKGIISAGIGILLIAAAILGHKKIKLEQVKNIEQEAQDLEPEISKKVRKAEEKLRFDSETTPKEEQIVSEPVEQKISDAPKKPPLILAKEEVENPKEVQEVIDELRQKPYSPETSCRTVKINNPEEYPYATIELKPDGTQVVTYCDFESGMEFFGGCPKKLIRKTYNKNGDEIGVLIIRPPKDAIISKDYIPDFEIFESRNGLPLHNIGRVENTPFGQKVEREFTSMTGTKSEYSFIPTEKGNKITYKITDKNGNVLMDTSRTFEKIDENHTRTIVKDFIYETEYNVENIVIKKLDKDGKLLDTKVLDIGGEDYNWELWRHYFVIPSNIIGDHKLDKNLVELYKQIQGDFLYKLAETNTKVRYGEPIDLNGTYAPYINTIFLNQKYKNCPFMFIHEQGHSVYYKMFPELQDNPRLDEILKNTRELYESKTSRTDKSMFMAYILNEIEAPAESFPIIFGQLNHDPSSAMRTILFQMEFADYIAEASKIINK